MYKTILAIITALFLIVSSFIFLQNANKDINTIKHIVSEEMQIKKEFESQRGFGNDRFDIYSFNLEKPKNLKNFKNIDSEYEYFSKNFKNMIDIEVDNSENEKFENKKIKKDMGLIENSDDGKYTYIETEKQKREMYIYSKNLNIGYYFVFEIWQI